MNWAPSVAGRKLADAAGLARICIRALRQTVRRKAIIRRKSRKPFLNSFRANQLERRFSAATRSSKWSAAFWACRSLAFQPTELRRAARSAGQRLCADLADRRRSRPIRCQCRLRPSIWAATMCFAHVAAAARSLARRTNEMLINYAGQRHEAIDTAKERQSWRKRPPKHCVCSSQLERFRLNAQLELAEGRRRLKRPTWSWRHSLEDDRFQPHWLLVQISKPLKASSSLSLKA